MFPCKSFDTYNYSGLATQIFKHPRKLFLEDVKQVDQGIKCILKLFRLPHTKSEGKNANVFIDEVVLLPKNR